MEKKFPIRFGFIIISLIILFLYSSEIDFMPNYNERPDKIYLAIWMLLFYPILFFMFCWAIFNIKIKTEKIEILIISLIMIIAFAMLNDPKGKSQIIGYMVMLTTFIVSTVRLIIIKRVNCSS